MTIVFQGHVVSLSGDHNGAPLTVAVKLRTPMQEANGAEWVIFVPSSEATHWMPGRVVSFTLYTLPEPKVSDVIGKALKEACQRAAEGDSNG